jgi:CheY-like chemotaxis protein
MAATSPTSPADAAKNILNRSNLSDPLQARVIGKCFDNSVGFQLRSNVEGFRATSQTWVGVMQTNPTSSEEVIKQAKVLIVDDEFYMRKVIRTLLLSMGVTNVQDVADGVRGLDAILAYEPDVVLLDWEMTGMNGTEFVRRVRSPTTFACPNVPIIMLTGHGEQWRVVQAMRLGVHEFLLKPVSGQALHARLASVLLNPRPMVRRGDYYGPQPRKILGGKQELASTVQQLEARMPIRPTLNPLLDRSSGRVIFVN